MNGLVSFRPVDDVDKVAVVVIALACKMQMKGSRRNTFRIYI